MEFDIKRINKNIKELSLNMNKKEDDLKNIINEKDNEIKEINKKLLEQENIIKENQKQISNLYNKIEEIINLFNYKFKENENKIDLIKDNVKNEKDNIFKEIDNKYDELQIMTNNLKNDFNEINKKNENYIIIKVLVKKDDINKDIIFINQCNIYKYYQNFELNDIDIIIDNEYSQKKYKNIHSEYKYDENSKNCEKSQYLSYELNKLYSFYCNFTNEGIHFIKIIFKTNLFSCKEMFLNCSKIIEIDCSHFNCNQVTSCCRMFKCYNSLKKINFGNLDFLIASNFEEMFYGCKNLVDLDVSNFNTKNSLSFSHMFEGCKNLVELDVSNFNTKNSFSFRSMFKGCIKLKKIDVSKFNSSKCQSIESMFFNCQNITEINMLNFNMSNIKNNRGIFSGKSEIENLFCRCRKLQLIKINLNSYDIENLFIKKSYFSSSNSNINIFEGIPEKGLFILKKRTENISLLHLPKNWIIKEE